MTWELFWKILFVVVLLIASAITSRQGTELTKAAFRWLSTKAKWLKWTYVQGVGSWILALIVAYAGVVKFDLNFLALIPGINQVNPQYVQLINIVLVWLGSNVAHSKLPTPLKPSE